MTIRDMAGGRCALCGHDEVVKLLEVARQPLFCNVLFVSADEALAAPVGDIELMMCRRCGVLWNARYDSARMGYSPSYENSLAASEVFRGYASDLARRLVCAYELSGGEVLEIGSGKGDFLVQLLDAGMGSAVGYDPSHREDGDAQGVPGISFVRSAYPSEPANFSADLVVCRHVLEHLDDPVDVLSGVRRAVGDRMSARAYLEVPDGGYLLRASAVWDVIYEHPWHFTEPALRRLVITAGFEPLAMGTGFHGQFLWVEAAPAALPSVESDVDAVVVAGLEQEALSFADRRKELVDTWSARLGRELDAGARVALWGAGSKGVTFLNSVPRADEIQSVVDLNVRKHGLHIPGTGQPVIGPEDLRRDPPDVVLVMNPVYKDEISAMVEDTGARVVTA